MDRITLAALLTAAASVAVGALRHGDAELAVRQGLLLLLPLAAIAFPDILDAAFRRSWGGFAHGGEAPTPGTIIRLAAWILLITMIVVSHTLG